MSEEVVNQVVRRVLEEMGLQGAPPRASDGSPKGASPAKAPQPVITVPGRSPLALAQEKPSPRRIWLTAEMIAARARGGSGLTLGSNEYLTPAARDYVGQCGIDVRRGDAPAAPVVMVPQAAASVEQAAHPAVLTGTIGLVVIRYDSKVQAALAGITRLGVQTQGFADTPCSICNTQAMCEALTAGRLAGGVVIDRYAAAPMLLAAKIKGIRPVQGVSAAAVEAGLRQYDANVLVIGCETVSIYEFRTMVGRFAAGRCVRRDRTRLMQEIDKLEAKG